MNVIRTLRYRLGMSQAALAKKAGITQSDLSEMETQTPYGYPEKYQRLSAALKVPVEALLKNKFTAIPESFFDGIPDLRYRPMPAKPNLIAAREGEEYILKRERERLAEKWPALSKLVLPFFKMYGERPGFDILSFDDDGEPLLLEVKTSERESNNFCMSKNELSSAEKYLESGERYVIVFNGAWGTEQQYVSDILYEEFLKRYQMTAWNYSCRPIAKKEEKDKISGLAKFRNLRGMTQAEVAALLGINQNKLSLYENGRCNAEVGLYIKMSEIYDATVDELLAEYELAGDETSE